MITQTERLILHICEFNIFIIYLKDEKDNASVGSIRRNINDQVFFLNLSLFLS